MENSVKQNGFSQNGEIIQNGIVGKSLPSISQDQFLQSLNEVTEDSFVEFIGSIDAVMFDCDGVLWLGSSPLPGAQELVKKLRSMKKRVFFVTNNSTKTREEFLQKFNKLGFEATVEEIVSTSYLAALYLKERNFDKKVYVVGSTGVTGELDAVGIQSLPIGPDTTLANVDNWNQVDLSKFEFDREVGAVIVGFDFHINYAKMCRASSYLSDKNIIFIATNTDESFPAESSLVVPGTGSIVKAVETAAGRPPVVMGKPSPIPFEFVKRSYNIEPKRTLMIGDRGNTDIAFARKCGLWSLLVLTGVTKLDEAKQWQIFGSEEEKTCVPNFYLDSIGDFYYLVARYNP